MFSAACYFFISVGYIMGYFVNDDVVCENTADGLIMRQGELSASETYI